MATSGDRFSPTAPRHVRRALLALFVLPLMALSAGRVAAPLVDAAGQAVQNAPTSVPEPVVTGAPSLELTWADDATHAGAAVGLTIQTRDADGQATTRMGTAVVALDDDRAEVRTAAGAAHRLRDAPG
jgi:hypothetical protein